MDTNQTGVKMIVLWFTFMTALHLEATEVKITSTPSLRIVFIGDSLSEGYGLPTEASFPFLVDKALKSEGIQAEVINAGVSGATSASGVPSLKWQLKQKPALILLALGANDGLRGIKPAATKANLSNTIELAQKEKIKVILAGMKMPPNYGAEFTKEFEAIFPALAKKYSLPLIPFLLEGVAGKKEFNLPDGIHPNAKGYELIAKNVLKILLPEIKKL
jgi:acyl-CoA thioesterase I